MAKSSKRFFLVDPLGGLTLVRRAPGEAVDGSAAGSGIYPATTRPRTASVVEERAFEDERPTAKLRILEAV